MPPIHATILDLKRERVEHPPQGPIVDPGPALAPAAPEGDRQARAVDVEEREPEVRVVVLLEDGRDFLGPCDVGSSTAAVLMRYVSPSVDPYNLITFNQRKRKSAYGCG